MPYDPSRHGPRRIVGPGFHKKVHAFVRQVPAGRVTTYGDLAEALGSRGVARQVGFAMAALGGGSDVPWWRVVAAGGRLAVQAARAQARALRAEGVAVKSERVQQFEARRFVFGDAEEQP
ncbi:MAG TPA: MGMT family protein [Planctomycetota bacterium]